jgi:antitoxin component YwqK of YwqJK toxin-antitoxin module
MKCILIIAIVLSSFSSFSQQSFALETQLTLKENKFYQRDKLYSGQVIYVFDNGQQKSIVEIKDGLPHGKTIEFLYDKSYQKKNYQDSVEIRKLNSLFSEKKLEIESNIQDTLEASKKEKDFLNYEIGGFDKLVKLKEKNNEGKLNQTKKEEFDKYEGLVQAKNKVLRKLNNSQQLLIELNQKIREETNKPNYTPKKAKEYAQTNQLKEGAAIIYDSLGNKFAEGNYKNGKQDGKWIYYYANGNKLGEGNFFAGDEGNKGSSGIPKNGRQGSWIFYHPNGKIDQELLFTNGVTNGNCKFYFENGSISQDLIYQDGQLNGNCKFYFENGLIKQDLFYKSGILDGSRKLYFSNGKLKENGTYVNGKASGHFVFNHENGSVWTEVDYKEGKKMGLEIVYNKEGKKMGEYFLTDNIKNGKEKMFYDNGKLREERTYKMGKDHGNTKIYYESGVLEIDAQFANGKPHGLWIKYFENGKIEQKFNCDTTSLAEGNLLGDSYSYNEDGSIKSHIYAHKDGRMEEKTGSNTNNKNSSSSNEFKKPYKCKCCKATINGLQEGVDIDGNEYLELYSQFPYYFLVEKFKFCTMKCARTCSE